MSDTAVAHDPQPAVTDRSQHCAPHAVMSRDSVATTTSSVSMAWFSAELSMCSWYIMVMPEEPGTQGCPHTATGSLLCDGSEGGTGIDNGLCVTGRVGPCPARCIKSCASWSPIPRSRRRFSALIKPARDGIRRTETALNRRPWACSGVDATA